jgi:hypothetical protein
MHLVGLIVRIYHDARLTECQIRREISLVEYLGLRGKQLELQVCFGHCFFSGASCLIQKYTLLEDGYFLLCQTA